MSCLSARFFTYIQASPFYHEVHRQAVNLLPPGNGQIWADIGCGPGLLAQLAHEHGYRAIGRDIDPAAIRQARELCSAQIRFEAVGLATSFSPQEAPQVISAASLLFVLPERNAALQMLAGHLAEGGTLLVVETTSALNLGSAWRWLREHGWPARAWVLLLWGLLRHGKAVSASELQLPGYQTRAVKLMRGLVCAWLIQPTASGSLTPEIPGTKTQ